MSEKELTNSTPLYVVSKGRHQYMMTSKTLLLMRQPHYIIVEDSELALYQQAISRLPHGDLITPLVLPKRYQDEYDTCDDLGSSKSKGPGPARNFAWEHSVQNNKQWHWVMDDNIFRFYRYHNNIKIPIFSPKCFTIMESFTRRYLNVGMAGPNYDMFTPAVYSTLPFAVNTRIYSCNLIKNDLPFRWRARYNEDTDLSLRLLKAGWCTIQFNMINQKKVGTQRMKGGNTKEFYEKEGTVPKSDMLVRLHPDVCRRTFRFNRPHHYVDYSTFKKMPLIRDSRVAVGSEKINEFGLQLVTDGA